MRPLIALLAAFIIIISGAGCREEPTAVPTSTPTPTPQPTYEPDFTPADCDFTIPEGAVVECGYVVAPEDRSGDLTDTIRIFVVIYKSSNSDPKPDPIIFISGGPGGEVIEWSSAAYPYFIAPFLETRDFVVFDPRGVGRSEPALNCDSLALAYLQDMQEDLSGEEREALYVGALEACRETLIDEGANLQAYTSAAVAADVADIAAVFGYDQVNLFGVSYGSRMAQVVMRDYPNIVRSAIFDSTVPLEISRYEQQAVEADQALDRLFEACAADPECAAAYPDLQSIFFELVERYNEDPLELEVPSPLVSGAEVPLVVSGNTLINMVIWAGHWSETRVIPQAIYDVYEGEYAVLERFVPSAMLAAYDNQSIGHRMSVECHEQVYSTTPDKLAATFAQYPAVESYALGSVFGTKDALFSICGLWDAAPFDPREMEPLVSDIPTLILAGEFDPTTPAAHGELVASHLSRAHLLVFPAVGHAPSTGLAGDCAREVAMSFLDAPLSMPDRDCIEAMPAIDFAAPYTLETAVRFAPFELADMRITGQAPADWLSIGSNFYNRSTSPLDPTQIGIHGDPIDIVDWVRWLTTNFAGQEGFDETPSRVGVLEVNGRTWALWATTYNGNPVDLAFTDTGDITMMVVMVSPAEEHDALYQVVFLPVIQAAAPIP